MGKHKFRIGDWVRFSDESKSQDSLVVIDFDYDLSCKVKHPDVLDEGWFKQDELVLVFRYADPAQPEGE